MPKRSAFVRGLIERYREALSEEADRAGEYERASRALSDTRETKKLCAALLKKEGVDTEDLERETAERVNKAVAQIEAKFGARANNGESPTDPLNATHAVYLVMRKHDNKGLMPEEIVTGSVEMGLKLSYQEVNKVIWTQIMKKRMEKLEDGRIRLTPEGEVFNSFRRKVEGEYKPMIQNFPTQVIK
jgi:hypothetical protein